MDRWTETRLFVQTAEMGSLSKAADLLNLSSSSASRYLASLEGRLGARLIERSTRRIVLTEVGSAYLARCKAILADLADADSMVTAASSQPSGTLRITASQTFCQNFIVPLLPAYHRRYPDVRFVIEAANRYPDLLESGMDLAIRTREFENNSSIIVRRLATTRRPITAAPSYLERAGVPRKPADLLQHNLLLYTLATRPHELALSSRQGRTETLQVSGFLESNDTQVLRAAALAGLGLLIQPVFAIREDLDAGQLVPVLSNWSLPPLTINVAYPSRKHVSAKVRTFIDFLADRFKDGQFDRRFPPALDTGHISP
ncbi:MAG: LysR substrate-binding domain-containing protein [Pigmentiphaga sp.]|uniref:LysR family transcriptional regulator n=1 Tax=Pigmentiphaga sp. TaxID=1977564 RepID=UPI0029B23C16|nr:LysR substrate-binding domain-containing protein [Pigmentiphaga sp.]MDX3906368.1 LysR substrate-binding domain-containing protein [Pigmentiphaga sp.]